jgi:hypothetical protein
MVRVRGRRKSMTGHSSTPACVRRQRCWRQIPIGISSNPAMKIAGTATNSSRPT